LHLRNALLSIAISCSFVIAQQTPARQKQNSVAEAAKQGSQQESGVKSEILAQGTSSWDGTPYSAYPAGRPELTVRKMVIPPHATLPWHVHNMPLAAYVLAGDLTVEKQDGTRKNFTAGESFLETVDIVHRGTAGDAGVTLIIFYAGVPGMPLSKEVK